LRRIGVDDVDLDDGASRFDVADRLRRVQVSEDKVVIVPHGERPLG
jgi:hypothetical protein